MDAPRDVPALTKREQEIARLTGIGMTASEIARELAISTRTVETHRLNMFRKLNVRNVRELMKYVWLNGLLS